MQITDFHATYYSYLLTRHSAENSVDALAATLQDSKVDLNPHQIETALFALSSPFSRGIIEADEAVTEKLKSLYAAEQERILEEISIHNSNYFEGETAKLAKWSKDIKIGIERMLREIDKAIDEVNVQLRGRQLTLQKRLELQEQLAMLEPKKKELRMRIYEEQDKIDDERNRPIDETKKKLAQRVESKLIFTVKWRVV